MFGHNAAAEILSLVRHFSFSIFINLFLSVRYCFLLSFSKYVGQSSVTDGEPIVVRDTKEGEEWIEVLSWKPRAFLYHNFLTKEEADHVIELAGDKIQRSQVSDLVTLIQFCRWWDLEAQ